MGARGKMGRLPHPDRQRGQPRATLLQEWHRVDQAVPAIADAFARLQARSAIIDGELCFCDERGGPNFRALHHAMRKTRPAPERLVGVAFDLMHLDGADLRVKPQHERRRRLLKLHGLDGPTLPVRRRSVREWGGIASAVRKLRSRGCRLQTTGCPLRQRGVQDVG